MGVSHVTPSQKVSVLFVELPDGRTSPNSRSVVGRPDVGRLNVGPAHQNLGSVLRSCRSEAVWTPHGVFSIGPAISPLGSAAASRGEAERAVHGGLEPL